jgi:hypothetical protein
MEELSLKMKPSARKVSGRKRKKINPRLHSAAAEAVSACLRVTDPVS